MTDMVVAVAIGAGLIIWAALVAWGVYSKSRANKLPTPTPPPQDKTPKAVRFGKRCLIEHMPDTEQPWGVMRYSDMNTFYFYYESDAQQFFDILESKASVAAGEE